MLASNRHVAATFDVSQLDFPGRAADLAPVMAWWWTAFSQQSDAWLL